MTEFVGSDLGLWSCMVESRGIPGLNIETRGTRRPGDEMAEDLD